jgi:hypothetical protein
VGKRADGRRTRQDSRDALARRLTASRTSGVRFLVSRTIGIAVLLQRNFLLLFKGGFASFRADLYRGPVEALAPA